MHYWLRHIRYETKTIFWKVEVLILNELVNELDKSMLDDGFEGPEPEASGRSNSHRFVVWSRDDPCTIYRLTCLLFGLS